MKTTRMGCRGGGRPPRGRLGDERGMILVITMIILLVLSTLAATDLINSFLERSLARNQTHASVAQTAADAGIATGIAWLNDLNPPQGKTVGDTTALNTAVPATWSKSFSATLASGAAGSAAYNAAGPQSSNAATTIKFKREGVDLNDDGDCTDPGESVRDLDNDGTSCGEVVFYTKCLPGTHGCFGYRQSAFANLAASPFPVIVVDSLGTYGTASTREIEMEIARDKYTVQAFGAVTAASSVEVSGNITVDGRAHDANGVLCSAGGNCTPGCSGQAFPGVVVPCPPMDINGNCVCDAGDTCYDATKDGTANLAGTPTEWEINSTNPQPYTPDEALGLDEGDLDGKLQGLPAPGTTKISGKITYINADHDLDTAFSGVLIVHNPLFEARKWESSDASTSGPPLNIPTGKKYDHALTCAQRNAPASNVNFSSYDPCLDTGCAASCTPALLAAAGAADQAAYIAARVPRNLEQHGNDTFKGVIIADKVDKINGTADIIGALISLSTVSIDKLGNGAAHISYSCDALAINTDVGFSIKLNWHRIR